MFLLLPLAIARSVSLTEGFFQFLVVVGLVFAAISLLVSFLRFQALTGQLDMETSEEPEPVRAANQFQTELLRRVGGGRSQSMPMVAANIGLSDRDALLVRTGEQGLLEISQWMQALARKAVRSADVVLQIDEKRLGIILSSCRREQGSTIIKRLLELIHSGLCSTGTGWTGHVDAYAGCVSFPENGATMLALVEALDQAVEVSASAENGLFFTDPPVRVERAPTGLLRDEDEDDDEEEEDADEAKQVVSRANPMVDPLTGVIREERLSTAMAKYMAGFRREGRPVTMLYLAIDHVERYLKQYGAGADEALLHSTGELLQRETRENDLLGRYGGDSFLALMNCTVAEGVAVARRLCAAARREQAIHGKWPLRMTVSVGVAGYPEHGRTPGELMRNAGWALREIRERGGNAALIFDRSLILERWRQDKMVDRF